MPTKTMAAALAAVAALALAGPALAHHSFAAQYDGAKPVRLTGKLVKIEWTNPHSYIHLAVTRKDGTVQEWACEGANPGALSRRGFKRGDIKVGDTLTIDGFLAKNGSHLIDARRIFLADGKVIYGGSAGDGGPGDTGAEYDRVLAQLLHALNETAFSTRLRESDWTFSIIETVHVLSIAVMAGTIALVDLRLLGVLFRRQRVSRVTVQVTPVTWIGFLLMAASGTLLFIAQPEKNAANPAFQVKLVLLLAAAANLVVFHRLVFRGVGVWDEQPTPPAAARLCGAVSLLLWGTIIVLGRIIAYFPEPVS